MQSYLVSINFNIRRAELDPTLGQTPPGTPEEIAELNPELLLVCKYESPNEPKSRFYRCEADIAAKNEGAAGTALAAMFSHLPDIVFDDATVEPVKDPPATAATKEYAIICHFRSTEAYFRLNNAFYEHVAEGFFFAAPKKPGHYVAYVVMHAPMSDGLEETVEALLRDTFDAQSAEKANHFAEVTTSLL